MGLKFADVFKDNIADLQAEMWYITYEVNWDQKDECIKFKLGKEEIQAEQVMGFFLGRMHRMFDNANIYLRNLIALSIPPYSTHVERKAYKLAAEIAGYQCLGVVPDNTATALAYQWNMKICRLPPQTVCFVNVGQSHTSFTVANI